MAPTQTCAFFSLVALSASASLIRRAEWQLDAARARALDQSLKNRARFEERAAAAQGLAAAVAGEDLEALRAALARSEAAGARVRLSTQSTLNATQYSCNTTRNFPKAMEFPNLKAS